MCFCGLPGGSPGPDARGSWATLLLAVLVTVITGGFLAWCFCQAAAG